MTELAKLSLDELIALQRQAAAEMENRKSAEVDKAREEILAIAAKYGLKVSFGGRAPRATSAAAPKARKSQGKVAPKYRHPQDASLTWTGRGRSPVWVTEWKAKHGSLDGATI
jgi:DNA-binding protein H-NS